MLLYMYSNYVCILTILVLNEDSCVGLCEEDSLCWNNESLQRHCEPLQLLLHHKVLKHVQSNAHILCARYEQQEDIEMEVVIWS